MMEGTTKTLALKEILRQMRDSIDNPDTEAAHGEADEFLVTALRYLAAATPDHNLVEAIIEAYREVPKWYA